VDRTECDRRALGGSGSGRKAPALNEALGLIAQPDAALRLGVVIPTRNRQQDLVPTVRAWLAQEAPIHEVVIVESGDLSKTREIMEQEGLLARVRLVESLSGLPRQRNVGFRYAEADILFLSDDDLTPEPRFAGVLAKHFGRDGNGQLGAVAGRIDDCTRLPGRLGQIVRSLFGLSRIGVEGRMQPSGFGIFPLARTEGVIPVEVLPGTCLAVRRSVYPEYSFDEMLEGYALMEDVDFTFRLGRRYGMLYDPSVTAVHHAAPAGRHSRRDYCAMMVVNYRYLFEKNRVLERFSRPAYWRALIGLVVYWGILRGIQERSLAPFQGLFKGIAMVRRGQMWPSAEEVTASNGGASLRHTAGGGLPRGDETG
jgi:GT2 family glycosyltransferase